MRLHQNLHILIERHEKTQKTFYRKLPQLASQHLGNIGLSNSEKIGRLDLFQGALFQECVNLANQLRLDEVLVRVSSGKILERASAVAFISLLANGCPRLGGACNIVISLYRCQE